MKRRLLAASVGMLLVALATPANAQQKAAGHGGNRGGGGGHAAFQAGGGGHAAIRSGGAAFRGAGRAGAGVQFRGNAGLSFRNNGGASAQFQQHRGAVRIHHPHFRGPVVRYGFSGPTYYEYAAPVATDECYEVRRVLTDEGWRYVQVYVCGDDEDDDD